MPTKLIFSKQLRPVFHQIVVYVGNRLERIYFILNSPVFLDQQARDTFNHIIDRKSTRLNSSHVSISYAVFCLKKKKKSYGNPNVNIYKNHRDILEHM